MSNPGTGRFGDQEGDGYAPDNESASEAAPVVRHYWFGLPNGAPCRQRGLCLGLPQLWRSAHRHEPAGGDVYHFKTDGYNPDGTDTGNPVVTLGTAPVDVSKYAGYSDYVFKTLTSGTTVTLGKNTYTVYAALPESMTVAQGFADTASYYPQVPATPPPGTTWGLWNNMFLQYPTAVEALANQAPYNTSTNTLSLPQIFNKLGGKLHRNHGPIPGHSRQPERRRRL